MRLSKQSVASLQIPAGKPYHIEWDEVLPGFGVRINPTGNVWVVQYRIGGKSRRETIGRVDTVSLDVARETAKKTLAKVQLGSDPHAEKAQAKARAKITFESVAERYLKHAQDRLKPRSFEEVERHLKKHWQPFQGLPISEIRRALVATRLEEIAEQSGPIASNRARAALSALFAWAVAVGLAESNPVMGTMRVAVEVSREHVVTDEELTAIWRACRDDDYGRIVRLLILTGQRRDEVGDMKWSEVDFDRGLWTIPRERIKNGLTHEVPLSDMALEILRSIPRREGRDFVFGEGQGGFSGWSKSKTRLDARIAKAGAVVRPWRLHDLRRTTATRIAEMGILPHVVEAILNHVSGHKAGVAGIYNRATYAKEKREALNGWADNILGLNHNQLPALEPASGIGMTST
ncbi:tyrosine-type recombinase/integrase [Microvirga sp. 3-52]|uniref:tyrosine-type recombinase/integrase n=1 Tax=Microvirga sp. 3-52 TaxID=2792425 RepID=UPI001ACC7F2E|nr:site-specific integrase [Microvirga sp. 3-52]MBO1908881.1 tyrosine-type recombinase/integrase [Microvirga sp. 3-52]MBS7455207.1 tyrosine-type recombinase/integrase [Microvirga sp. 3-52]